MSTEQARFLSLCLDYVNSYVWFAPLPFPFLAAAVASDPQNPRTLNKHAAPAPDATRAASPIRVNVRMTLVPVTVTDQLGRNVTGLNKDNFKNL